MKLDILAIAVHPDDVELGCAGTLMVHAQQGMKVGVVDLTRGELGTRGTPELREQEAQDAAKIMGLEVRENLGLADGFFRNDTMEQLAIIAAIRKFQPDIVLANAMDDRHPDHGRAGKLIADSCFLAGLRKVITKGADGQEQAAWRPKQVFHFLQDRYHEPDFVVDITPVMEKKLDAIRSFSSQFLAAKDHEPQTYISGSGFFDSVIYRAKMLGKMVGVAYAEGYTSAKMVGIRNFADLINEVT
ncbi:bacillithiol biosynthesis deacetylase BshB1 [Chitinophaga nivalis]|uniref:Bacillithiol biosynthesis deacetylase BshB1 n=1 Tax=Chitinophaga nivalis TaxID=2991709 RepID=A0ABT3IHQ1_9BACT|nr:bacillithiol biosynthesis deacetylase BshB1 [Chitinophaga nivalis]MCW3466828.1 bacillithiol biosynthesis deacetylase BshB1 [Chitinophaga nivalis]MCW3483481.1 bacillithiol biosynthesis deacetylase BshB1 [Chitinophaga nivalis]